jgi:hypothetical protein
MLKLYACFGAVGIASIACWVAALLGLACFSRSARRNLRYLLAVGLALAGVVLARINSAAVNEIRVDRTAEIEAARAQQRQMRLNASGQADLASQLRFAEDSPSPAETSTNLVAVVPAYAQSGRQQRAAGRREKVGEAAAIFGAAVTGGPRTMKEPDVLLANRLDRHNLRAARAVLWLSVLLLIADYLVRFNRWMPGYPPLPLASPWIDHWSPKSFDVAWPAADRERLLRDLVRRGETFLYLGPDDPLPGVSTLPRLAVAASRSGPLHRLHAWPLSKLLFDAQDPRGPEFLFDAVWFGRYAAVYTGPAAALERALGVYLEERQRTGARVRRSVNLVCAADALDPANRKRLLRLLRAANWRLCELA